MNKLFEDACAHAAAMATIGTQKFHKIPKSPTFHRAEPHHLGGGNYTFRVQLTPEDKPTDFGYDEYKEYMSILLYRRLSH